ncbi:XdhC family protein [Altererythrobacter arenosus]|uniref:XdhC family protein n=1 Tax=Altererythrobacter arenosus TaxID=3032592 RepID=A0ABY8FRX6_9SPHN|nr:XdhC family protein [Altererythrobacter sp. CAU 1644]WFL77771.1 XdhC family protein [Altererythrobacter sp. CAU 1644]
MFDAPRILSFLRDSLTRGQRACLVTVTDVTGASVRNPGAHMAVVEDGRFSGSLSGGCIEQAVVGEALKAIEAGMPHRIAYGAGTPIIDIRLPCGGRVDLLFTPLCDPAIVEELLERLDAREAALLALPTGTEPAQLRESGETGWDGEHFLVRHHPPLRLVIAGHGGTVETLVRQAAALDIECCVASPDPLIVEALASGDAQTQLLGRLGEPLGFALDQWTAAAFFFHDHDWETALMAEALASPVFYVGAMGSHATHESRIGLLRDAGAAESAIDRIVAPIGLIPSSRDPETLALSVLVQVVDRYNAVIGAQFSPSRDP